MHSGQQAQRQGASAPLLRSEERFALDISKTSTHASSAPDALKKKRLQASAAAKKGGAMGQI